MTVGPCVLIDILKNRFSPTSSPFHGLPPAFRSTALFTFDSFHAFLFFIQHAHVQLMNYSAQPWRNVILSADFHFTPKTGFYAELIPVCRRWSCDLSQKEMILTVARTLHHKIR